MNRANRQERRQERQGRRHPKPPTSTTLAPASPPPVPQPSANTYIIRLYDYCTVYSPYVVNAFTYYQSWMSAYGVDVQYIRMSAMDGQQCWAMPSTPRLGIRLCEEIKTDGSTAYSTGMYWNQTGPTQWELGSQIIFNARDWDAVYTGAVCGGVPTAGGDYAVAHELGHSIGNLRHRPDDGTIAGPADMPYSCMSISGSWCPSTLWEEEKRIIIGNLPTSAMGLRARVEAPMPCKGLLLPTP